LIPKRQLLLEPGAREEVLVQAAGPGTYALRTAPFSTGPQGNHYLGAVLATLHVAGAAVTPIALPENLLPVTDLRGAVTGRRTIVFSETEDGTRSSSTAGRLTPAAPIRASSSGRWRVDRPE